MKRTKLFLIVAMLVCSMGAWAQDSYREAFEAYLSNNPSAGNWGDVGSNLKPAFEMINKTVLKHYTEATIQCVDRRVSDKTVRRGREDKHDVTVLQETCYRGRIA